MVKQGAVSPEVAGFWQRVRKTETCWLWEGAKSRGYGRYRIVRSANSRRCHRIAWELTHGPIPDGLKVLHRCDTPACVNPAHLFLGTQRENVHDAIAKGRHVNPREAVAMSRAAA
jgi:hypothetical protein